MTRCDRATAMTQRAQSSALARQSEREEVRASEWSEQQGRGVFVHALALPVGPSLMYGRHVACMAYGWSATDGVAFAAIFPDETTNSASSSTSISKSIRSLQKLH